MNAARPALLAGALLALGLLFRDEILAALHVWGSSTAYGHCYLVLPIAAFLAYERRAAWRAAPPGAGAGAALLALPLAALWFASDLLGIMEGRQLAALGLGLLLVPAVYGWARTRAVAVPLAYCVFLVPFGSFLTPVLQRFTAGFIAAGLDLLGIPSEVTAFRIEIPEGVFYVAEACAGLRFLIASVAFGALYAVTMYRSPGRRVAFIAASAAVPVLANGFRALGIVLLGHVRGSAEAGAADHLIYGWVFFSFVLLLLALGGLPFREDGAPAEATAPAAPASRLRVAPAALAVAVAASAPALSAVLGRGQGAFVAPEQAVLAAPEGCRADGAGFVCGGARIDVLRGALPFHANPTRVLSGLRDAAAQAVGGEPDLSVLAVPGGAPPVWTLLTDHERGRACAYALSVDGVAGAGGLGDRLRLARDFVLRRGTAPRYTIVVADAADGAPDRALSRVIGAAGAAFWAGPAGTP